MATGHFVRSRCEAGIPCSQGRGRGQGPELLPLYAGRTAARARACSRGRCMTRRRCAPSRRKTACPPAKRGFDGRVLSSASATSRRFLQGFLPMQPGQMRDRLRRVVGEHIGLAYYTLGQRRGLASAAGGDGRRAGSWWKRTLQTTCLWSSRARTARACTAGSCAPRGDVDRRGGARAGGTHAPDGALPLPQGDQAVTVVARGRPHGEADELQRAVTRGQSVVLYDGDVCPGGAVGDAAHDGGVELVDGKNG